MDTGVIETAIRNAMAAGAEPPVRMYPSAKTPADLDIVRARTEVAMEQSAFNKYLAELRREPQLRLLDEAYATAPTGGGISVNLQGVARPLLAEAIFCGNVPEAVERFRAYIENNSARLIAVMAVSGVKVGREVQLGPEIRLVPMTSIPPSLQRGGALGQRHLPGPTNSASPIPSALTIEFEYGPIFYWPSEGESPSTEAHQRVANAIESLSQARCLFSLLDTPARYRQSWVQPKCWLTSVGLGAATFVGDREFFGLDVQVDITAAEELAAAYFGIDAKRRHDTLRIPLDRLSRDSLLGQRNAVAL
jgi:hypothetical protein